MDDMSVATRATENGAGDANPGELLPTTDAPKRAVARQAKGVERTKPKRARAASKRAARREAARPEADKTNAGAAIEGLPASDLEDRAADRAAPDPDRGGKAPEAATAPAGAMDGDAGDEDSRPNAPAEGETAAPAEDNADVSVDAASGIEAIHGLMQTLRARGRDCLEVWRAIARQLIALRGEFPSDTAFGRALKARGITLSRDEGVSDEQAGADEAASDHPTPQARALSAPPSNPNDDASEAGDGEALGDRSAPKPARAPEVRARELDELEALAEDLLARLRALRAA